MSRIRDSLKCIPHFNSSHYLWHRMDCNARCLPYSNSHVTVYYFHHHLSMTLFSRQPSNWKSHSEKNELITKEATKGHLEAIRYTCIILLYWNITYRFFASKWPLVASLVMSSFFQNEIFSLMAALKIQYTVYCIPNLRF